MYRHCCYFATHYGGVCKHVTWNSSLDGGGLSAQVKGGFTWTQQALSTKGKGILDAQSSCRKSKPGQPRGYRLWSKRVNWMFKITLKKGIKCRKLKVSRWQQICYISGSRKLSTSLKTKLVIRHDPEPFPHTCHLHCLFRRGPPQRYRAISPSIFQVAILRRFPFQHFTYSLWSLPGAHVRLLIASYISVPWKCNLIIHVLSRSIKNSHFFSSIYIHTEMT